MQKPQFYGFVPKTTNSKPNFLQKILVASLGRFEHDYDRRVPLDRVMWQKRKNNYIMIQFCFAKRNLEKSNRVLHAGSRRCRSPWAGAPPFARLNSASQRTGEGGCCLGAARPAQGSCLCSGQRRETQWSCGSAGAGSCCCFAGAGSCLCLAVAWGCAVELLLVARRPRPARRRARAPPARTSVNGDDGWRRPGLQGQEEAGMRRRDGLRPIPAGGGASHGPTAMAELYSWLMVLSCEILSDPTLSSSFSFSF